MTFKVNYGFQKAERDRAKQAKKEAKRREKEEAASKVDGTAPDEHAPGEESESTPS
ncbi:hypothetical protein [Lichenicoccus sp.]|uniref:hypothetical protein n=1 Tax=Lichenicoccus sp. TaxID=2781899 RepID=UPI003D0B2110